MKLEGHIVSLCICSHGQVIQAQSHVPSTYYLEEPNDDDEANKKDFEIKTNDNGDKTRDIMPVAGVKVCHLFDVPKRCVF